MQHTSSALLKTVTPAELRARMIAGEEVNLLDVRTPAEFARAHVACARLIPLGDLDADMFLKTHRSGEPIYVLCQAGQRACAAIEQFQRAGCNDGVLVEGGTQAWIDAGLPVVRGTSSALPLMRQVQLVVGSISAIGALLALTVDPWFAVLPLLIGCGLLLAGVTGTCGMALLLAKMPWNRAQTERGETCAAGEP
jgi:rhodanese-related sulfurtransferase